MMLLTGILLEILSGIFLRFFKFKNDITRKIFTFILVLIGSIYTLILLFIKNDDSFILIQFTQAISIEFKLDGLGKMFAGLVSILWPFATLYTFNYMNHEDRKESYTAYYVMTFGVVLGICFSANLFTMYVFYELLTFVTVPLIIQPLTKEAKQASRIYLYFSITGSSLALIGLITLAVKAGSTSFIIGGYLGIQYGWAFLLAFFGFGVKAAIFPVCFWLPSASVAPTPTTALLHAVAVVKAGAFAIMRISFYCFKFSEFNGSFVQTICIVTACITIVYGSTMALKEQHFKRRLAYSTISNLSYIVLGTVLFTKYGLLAAMLHFVIHSITKIGLFFNCGAIIHSTDAHYVYELDGLGKKMPVAFTMYLISSLSLTGIPMFAGFVSKWYLASAALESVKQSLAILAIVSLLISALLTACYTLGLVIKAYVNKPNVKYINIYNNAKELNKSYLTIIGVFVVLCIAVGVAATPLIDLFTNLIGGLA